ncbi:MAG: tRNA pseudouridine(13) synthase TruD [Euryarchaeota archaeon]|jgi:tRNA pseudouridine13 synthase|nr:tRNA pseudouridine(13) synthase TruD [Euryarchaeota archaeon]MBT7245099.1 tRNA pseudouridine(13) synthase TruD [Euryarchaeota archaeon]
MSSEDSLANTIGLTGYAVSGKGIGGVLKARVTDFRVEEISTKISLDPKGRFTAANVTLTNWETNRFIGKLAKSCGISRNRIFFAGTKDKRAVTRQVFIIDAPTKKVAQVSIPDVEIEIIGRTHQKLGFGNHRGNRFTIVARGCCHPDGSPMTESEAMERISEIESGMKENLGNGLFPNWIGPQRFGAGRPVTPIVGRHVISNDWKSAVMTYLSMEGDENDDVANFRKHIRDNGVTQEGLDIIPHWLGFERDMLRHLVANPEDWVGAFRKLPNNLQLMTVHSLQSVAFNKTIRARINAEISLSSPVEGDIVGRVDENGQLETSSMVKVEERTLNRISRNCKLGRLVVTGQLPGSILERSEGLVGEIEKSVLDEMELANTTWKVEDIGRLTTKGTRRPLVTTFSEFQYEPVPIAGEETMGDKWTEGVQDGDLWHPEGACIRFRFILPSGSYATTLLREFMRTPLQQL